MGEQDYSITTTRFSGDGDGRVAALHIARAEPAPPFGPVAGTERELPAQLVLLAMGFLHPEQGLLDQLGVEKDPRGNVKAREAVHDLGRGRVRRRRRPPRAVADRVGDQRGPPVRAHGRPLPRGQRTARRGRGLPEDEGHSRPRRRRRGPRGPAAATSARASPPDEEAQPDQPVTPAESRNRPSQAAADSIFYADVMSSTNGSRSLPRACIIGAGSSGIAAAKALHERGIPFDCFEKSDQVGGNWVFGNRNGMSAAYRDLFINVSRERMAVLGLPDARLLSGLSPPHAHRASTSTTTSTTSACASRSPSRPRVEHAARREDGVLGGRCSTRRRDPRLRRAAGRQRPPLGPALARTGASPARTRSPASSCTRTPTWTTRSSPASDVVVLGMGNSAMDIAVESSYVAAHTYLAARQGAWIIPKYVFGKPVDQLPNDPRVPFAIRQRMIHQMIKTLHRRPRALRAAQARPQVRRGPPDRLRAHPRPHRSTARSRPSRTSPRWRATRVRFVDGSEVRGRRGRLLHRLQDQLPVLRRGLPVRARQPHRAVPPRLSPRHPRPVLHRPAAAARRDHAAGRGPERVGRRPPARRLRAASAGRDARGHRAPTRRRCASATSPPSATRSRSTSTTTCTSSRRARAARRARASAGSPCPTVPLGIDRVHAEPA